MHRPGHMATSLREIPLACFLIARRLQPLHLSNHLIKRSQIDAPSQSCIGKSHMMMVMIVVVVVFVIVIVIVRHGSVLDAERGTHPCAISPPS